MSVEITYPELRLEILDSLRSLSDRHHQSARWGLVEEGVNYYDDLTLNVHTLYDDTQVLPTPEDSVPTLIYPAEVRALRELDKVLAPMIADLGNAPDSVYLADERWPSVVDAAAAALAAMQASEAR